MSLLQAFLNGSKDLPFWALGLRAAVLYIALIVATRAMGHRQVGILTGHNYLVAAGIVSLAAIRMISPESSLISGLIIVFVYAGANVLLSFLDLKFPKMVDRRPVILMAEGQISKRNMMDAHVTLDNLLGQARLKGAHNLSEVDSLVLEPTGKISVLKKSGTTPVTRKQMNLPPKSVTLPVVLVYDGRVQHENLAKLGLDLNWLTGRLNRKGFEEPSQVFLAALEPSGDLFISAQGV